MRVPRALFWCLASVLGGALAATPALGQGLGSGLRINTGTTATQNHPSVAALPGGFVVVWEDESAAPDPARIAAQRFSASGVPVGVEVVYTGVAGNTEEAREPKISPGPAGGFLVAWQQNVGYNNWEIYVRRFTSTGEAIAREVQVNTFTPGSQRFPSISFGGDTFVVIWQSTGQDDPGNSNGQGVFGRRYVASTGAAAGGQFRVNTTTTGNQTQPVVSSDAAGGFVVVWTSADASGTGVFAQRFEATGAPIGDETQANSFATFDQDEPSVTHIPGAQVLFTFTNGGAQNGTDRNISGRRFNGAWSAAGGDFRINATTTYQQGGSVAAANDEQYLVAWLSNDQDGSSGGIYARRFDATGAALTGEFLVNSYTTGHQNEPAVALDAQSRYVIVWTYNGDIYGARGPIVAGDVDASGVVDVSDILYLINHLFASGPVPPGDADANGDLAVDVSDVLYLINYLFAGGPPPV